MNAVYQDLAKRFEEALKSITGEIGTFESILKDKRFGVKTHNAAKEVLKTLYRERDTYATKAKWYREICPGTQGCRGTLTFGKKRA